VAKKKIQGVNAKHKSWEKEWLQRENIEQVESTLFESPKLAERNV